MGTHLAKESFGSLKDDHVSSQQFDASLMHLGGQVGRATVQKFVDLTTS